MAVELFLPDNIPVSIPVDLTELQIGEFITVADLDAKNLKF